MDIPWEEILATVFGVIASFLAKLMDSLPARTRSVVMAVIAIALYGAAWLFVPMLGDLSLIEVLTWGLVAAGIGGFGYSAIQVAKRGTGQKPKK